MRRVSRLRFVGVLGAAAAVLAGCASTLDGERAAVVYQRYATELAAQGRFREDFRPSDVVYTNAELVEHFDKVVFLPEAANARFRAQKSPTRTLSKWTRPIRFRFHGSPDLEDISTVAGILADFRRYTSLEIAPAEGPEAANLTIYVLDAGERKRLESQLRDQTDSPPSPILKAWVNELELPCFGLFRTVALDGGEILRASIFVKDELTNPFRRACFVEELSQALGLTNDHDDVRPSIFNDDQEFIALTEHDSYLIRLLYDPQMRPGMTRAEAMIVAKRLVNTIRPETRRNLKPRSG